MYEAIFGALERAIGSDDIWIYKRVSTQDFHRVSISFYIYIYISSLLCIEGPHIYGVYTKFILGLEYGRGSCKSSRSSHSCGKGRREELCFFSQCSLSYIILYWFSFGITSFGVHGAVALIFDRNQVSRSRTRFFDHTSIRTGFLSKNLLFNRFKDH